MRRISKTLPALSVLTLALLTACGGGGGVGEIIGTSLSGTVIDGYIEGAEVCLDLDGSLTCNNGEPTATTIANGTFKLDTTGLTTAAIKAAHLLTNVPLTAKDADDKGLTLEKAGKSAFNLLAPATSYVSDSGGAVTGAVISPLTTMVSHDMIASRTSLETAEKTVRSSLSLKETTDLRQDFVAKENKDLMKKAQILAVAIGSVKAAALADSDKEIFTATGATPTEKQALLAALTYLQNQVADLESAYKKAETKAEMDKTPINVGALVSAALKSADAKPVIANLVAEAKKTSESSVASSVVAIIEQGFYNAQHVLEPCGVAQSYCTTRYSNVQGSGGKISLDNDYVLKSSKWELDLTSNDNDFVLTKDGWKKEDECPAGQSITYSADSAGLTTVNFCDGSVERATARTVDASGKTLAQLGLKTPADFGTTLMPTGSQLYWFDFANQQNKYVLYTGGGPIRKYVYNFQTNISSSVEFANLDGYIAAYSTTGSPEYNFTGRSGLYFSFDADGTAAGGTVSLWTPSSSSSSSSGSSSTSPTLTGVKADYVRTTISGQEVLYIKAKAPNNDRGEWVMFGVKGGKVYDGSFRAAGSAGANDPVFNKTMMNAILKAGKNPEVVK